MNWQTLIIAVLALAFIHMLLDKQKGSTAKKAANIDYSKAYQAKYLLTKNEWHEYKKLKELAAGKGLQICPKVRVLDIIEPRTSKDHYMTLLNKVQSKHIDFLVTDNDLRIMGIIELDDNSHNKMDRQERDEFLDTILKSVGYKVVHTKSITEETLKQIGFIDEIS